MLLCVHVQGYPAGFPVLLPNRLSQQRSTAVLQYLLDGNYLDRDIRQLTAEAVTYNADLQVLGYIRATFDWQADGAIKGAQGCMAGRMTRLLVPHSNTVYVPRPSTQKTVALPSHPVP